MVNLVNKNILIITEGDKKEINLMRRLNELFIDDNCAFVSYKTNLYQFYNNLKSYTGGDFSDLDLLLALREHEQDEEKKKLFNKNYTSIILIFDYEPQDNNFKIDIIKELMNYFSDASDMGQLFLNYPMVESFYHLRKFDSKIDKNFINSKFSLEELQKHKYKKRATDEDTTLDVKRMTKIQLKNILCQHACKANLIVNNDNSLPDGYNHLFLTNILDKQNELLLQSHEGYIISTCGFYVLENYPDNIWR